MATSTMVAGVQTVSELATSALAAVAGLFSPNKAAEPNEPKQVGSGKSAGSDKAESPKAEAGVAPDTDGKDFEKALEVQEKSLQLEADKRMRKVKAEAAASPKAPPNEKVNPDG